MLTATVKKILFFIFVAASLPLSAAAQINVTAAIDLNSMTLEDQATITVNVAGSMSAPDPVAPRVPGLDIVQVGRSSQIQIINGSVTTTAQFSFTVIASEEGAFQIPPFTVSTGGREYRSNSLKLSVTKGGYSNRAPPNSGNPFAQQLPGFPRQPGIPQTQPDRGTAAEDPFWITTTVSKTNPKVSEQILFRFKLYARQTADIVDLELPKFDDFLAEEVVPEKKGTEIVSGQRYSTYEVIYALSPLKSGTVKIGQTRLKLRYFVNGAAPRSNLFDRFFEDPFFNRGSQPKDKVLAAPPIDLEVAALPEPVPEDFTGLVGRFGVRAESSSVSLVAGDSLTYTVTLSGKGNIKDAKLPSLEIPEAKIYEDKPVIDTKKSEDGVSGSKTFKIAIVPSVPGDFKIPARTLSYYDVSTERYEKLALEGIPFRVTPSAQQENVNAVMTAGGNERTARDDLAYTDLAPLVNDAEEVLSHRPWRVADAAFFAVSFGLPCGFLFLLSWLKFKPGRGRFHERKLKKSRLSEVYRLIEGEGGAEAEVLERLQHYFGSFTDGSGRALTAPEIEKLCLDRGVNADDSRKLRGIVERLEASRYGFEKGGFGEEWRAGLKAALRSVEGKLGAAALLFLIAFSTASGTVRADGESQTLEEFSQRYEAAKRAYYEKDFAAAQAGFSELLSATGENGYLYYDLGNVFFKTGKIGQAVRHYEKARRLIPRFADLKTNLKQAEARRDVAVEASFWDYLLKTFYFWNGFLSLDEFKLVFMGVSAVFWGYLCVRALRRRRFLGTVGIVATLAYAYLAFGIYLKRDAELPGAYGIVIERKVEARASYLEKEQPLFILGEGAKVRLIDRQDFGDGGNWVRVMLPQGQKGWVDARAVGEI